MGRPSRFGCSRQRRAVLRLTAPFVLLALVACEGTLPVMDHDRYGELTRDDFRHALEPRPVPSSTPAAATDGPPIPDLQPLIELPPPLSPTERRLVSLAVNETVPLKDVLIELARRAEVDLELDPQIAGGIILTMRERPLREVIERVADLAGLRFAFQGTSLRIERDLPYYVNYRVDYLHLTRQANSVVETSVNVMGSDQGTNGNASSSAVSGQSDVNFWQELEYGLRHLLLNSRPRRAPVLPAAAPAAPAQGAPGAVDPAEAALDQAYENALQPPADAVPEPTEPEALFTTNRQAGLVSVFATRRQHELVAAYLAELHESISRQVLIEAKILEVALRDEFSSGINWRAVLDNLSIAAPLGTSVAAPPFNTPFDATADVVTVALDRGDLDVIANFIQRFGTVRTLSSPRITVLQNQTAVLKVAENQVFFRLFFERIEEDDGDDQININSEIRTVPIGVIVTVQPSINRGTQEISMALRPTVTRVVDVVNDPAVAIASNNTVVSQIPVIAVQEIDSVVTMRSGQVVVMGGLMHDMATNRDEGVPALGQLPGFGYLFKARQENTKQSELVMFLRATIVDDGGIDPLDADLYRRFGRDRRPFAMPGGP